MKNCFQLSTLCLLSVFATLTGTSIEAEAHTVNLAFRCEGDGSVTFYAAEHTGREENSGDIVLSEIGAAGTAYPFDGWVADLPSDVDDELGWQGDFDESEVKWQTVNVPRFRSGVYNIFTRNTEEDVPDDHQETFWEAVVIDCGPTVAEVDIDVLPGSDPNVIDLNTKDKDERGIKSKKDKDNNRGKAKGKAKGHSKDKDKGKGHSKGMSKGKDKGVGKGKGRGEGKAIGINNVIGKGKAKGIGNARGKGKDGAKGNSQLAGDTLPVAVFSDANFDATRVDEETVELGDEGLDGVVYPLHAIVEDVNGDGIDDLVLGFSVSEMVDKEAIDEETVELRLRGFTDDGLFFVGYDIVWVLH